MLLKWEEKKMNTVATHGSDLQNNPTLPIHIEQNTYHRYNDLQYVVQFTTVSPPPPNLHSTPATTYLPTYLADKPLELPSTVFFLSSVRTQPARRSVG